MLVPRADASRHPPATRRVRPRRRSRPPGTATPARGGLAAPARAGAGAVRAGARAGRRVRGGRGGSVARSAVDRELPAQAETARTCRARAIEPDPAAADRRGRARGDRRRPGRPGARARGAADGLLAARAADARGRDRRGRGPPSATGGSRGRGCRSRARCSSARAAPAAPPRDRALPQDEPFVIAGRGPEGARLVVGRSIDRGVLAEVERATGVLVRLETVAGAHAAVAARDRRVRVAADARRRLALPRAGQPSPRTPAATRRSPACCWSAAPAC